MANKSSLCWVQANSYLSTASWQSMVSSDISTPWPAARVPAVLGFWVIVTIVQVLGSGKGCRHSSNSEGPAIPVQDQAHSFSHLRASYFFDLSCHTQEWSPATRGPRVPKSFQLRVMISEIQAREKPYALNFELLDLDQQTLNPEHLDLDQQTLNPKPELLDQDQ